jgi:hypothetical protein
MGTTQKYSDEAIVTALRDAKGMVYLAARNLGCSPDTIYERRKTVPVVGDVITECRGVVIDTAEQKLWEAIEKGEPWAIQMALKTIGKKRGYVEKQELDVTGLPPISVVRVPSKRTDDDGGGDDGSPRPLRA